jgi:hypothetical protein
VTVRLVAQSGLPHDGGVKLSRRCAAQLDAEALARRRRLSAREREGYEARNG